MSNPYLTTGSQLPDFTGVSVAYRTKVDTINFNDNNLRIINGRDKTVGDAGGLQTLFVDPIYDTEKEQDGLTPIQVSSQHIPPFINFPSWLNGDTGILYNGSFSILSNGALINALLVPDRAELINNVMKSSAANDGTSGTTLNNNLWTWRARKITKIAQEENPAIIQYDEEEYDPKYFDTKDKTTPLVARTDMRQKMNQIFVTPNATSGIDEGICLEMPADEVALSSVGTFVNEDDNAYARLGSFMLLLSLRQEEQISGDNATKSPPWDVTIRLGENKNPGTSKGDLEATSNIVLKLNKNNTAKLKIFDQETEFNIPAPPVSTSGQGAGGEDPNVIALSFIPSFNGLYISVGNWNGLDKKVSGRMSQFCERNPALNIETLYSEQVNPDYPENDRERTSPFADSDWGSDTEVGPSVEIMSTAENDSKNGLIAIGDMVSVDLFNVTGHISYIPLFFQTHSEATLYLPIESDLEEAGNTSFVFWPLWCKNGMTAEIQKQSASIADYTQEDIKRNATSYSRTWDGISEFSINQVTISGTNPFSAGDQVKITNLPIGSPIVDLTNSAGNVLEWQSTNLTDYPSEPVSASKVQMISDKKGSMLEYKFTIRSGNRSTYNFDEDNAPTAEKRFNAIIERFNECNYSRYPIIMFGCTVVRKEEINFDNIHNDNIPLFNLGTNWTDCILNAQISYNLDSVSGSLTLDRFALNQIYGNSSDFGLQQIGQIDLDMIMSKSGIDAIGTQKYGFKLGRNIESNQGTFFKGFGYGFGYDQSSDSHTLKIPIFGIDKKLNEMKLLNSPFFDGETVKKTVDFMCGYGNVEPDYSYAKTDDKLSSSSELGQVLHEFKAGTSLWDAIQEASEDTTHYAIVQPDGKLYLYKFDQYGQPDSSYFTPINWDYPNARIINTSKNPDFSQFYNKIVVLAQQNNAAAVANNGDRNPLDYEKSSDQIPLFPIAVGADLTQQTIPHIPWEKLIIYPLASSFWTKEALAKYAKVLARQALQIFYTGTTSIPGNLGIRLWDKFNDLYWIQGITHTFDATTKSFTTDLQLATLKAPGTITYDSNDNPIIIPPTSGIEPYVP